MEFRRIDPPVTSAADQQLVYEPVADIRRIWGVIRRQYVWALLGAVLALAAGAVFVSVVQPSYTGTVRLLLDQQGNRFLSGATSETGALSAPVEDYVATQIAVIKSDLVARRVIAQLDLVWDNANKRLTISESPTGDRARLGNRLDAVKVTSEQLSAAAIDPSSVSALMRNVFVSQVDKSMVIEIAASDPDPIIAQKIAAAYGQAYLDDQLSARYEASSNAGVWLEERINTLRQQSIDANNEVEAFRAANNLVSTDGRLVSDQQLQQLNEQLSASKSAVTRAAAKVAVFENAVQQGNVDAVISPVATAADIPENAPIRLLRNDYLQAKSRESEIVARWGADNDQAVALRAELQRLSASIIAEARVILESYRNDLRVAESEAQSVSDAFEKATGRSQADNSTLVKLRTLEQRSASYNSLYQEYLARYQEAMQQQTLSLSSARLIAKAEEPRAPTFPKKKIILALALILGIGAGSAFGVGREMSDRTFRSRRDVERFRTNFLGYVPRHSRPPGRRRQRSGVDATDLLGAAAALRMSQSMKTTRLALEIHRRSRQKLVGLFSLSPTAARSAFALALAEAEASSGQRVLLVDGDLSVRALSQALSEAEDPSLADVLGYRLSVEQAAKSLPNGVSFLPAGNNPALDGAIAWGGAAENIRTWLSNFDIVIFDMPPAASISEAQALAPSFDSFVCVVDWGRTDTQLLEPVLKSSPLLEGKLVGVAIANVASRKLHLYDTEANGR